MAIRLFGNGGTQDPTSNYIDQFWVFSDNLMDTNTMDSWRGEILNILGCLSQKLILVNDCI